jgi:hypothetical protein
MFQALLLRYPESKMLRFLAWFALGLVLVLAVAGVALLFIDEPFRAFAERQLNANVQGYSFTLGKAHLSPLLTLDLENLEMIQTEHPDPPVAHIPKWHFSVQWRELLRGHLVSDYLIERPTLHITLPQAKKETNDPVPIHEKGWRDAVYSFYPFKINEFRIADADVTYVDQDPSKPLHITHLNFRAANIRNIRFPNDTYPSDIKFDGVLFDTGNIRMNGKANFMAEPHFGFNANVALEHVSLEHLLPVTGRYNFQLRGGVLSADGHAEYTAEGATEVDLKTLTVEGAHVDYVHAAETQSKERDTVKTAATTAKDVQNKPGMLLRISRAVIKDSEFGFVNKAAKVPYRVFLTKGELHLDNISNQFTEGTGIIKVKGEFMGSGATLISGTFRPEKKSPDFDLNVKIEKTQVRAMNDLLRAYGGFDVTRGEFSVYSELTVQNNEVRGYVKPLFKDLKVYDPRQDKDKTLFQKLYEGVVGGIAKLLENRPREEVATRTDVSGEVGNVRTSTWQTFVNLIQNAFFRAILPGFEREAGRANA